MSIKIGLDTWKLDYTIQPVFAVNLPADDQEQKQAALNFKYGTQDDISRRMEMLMGKAVYVAVAAAFLSGSSFTLLFTKEKK